MSKKIISIQGSEGSFNEEACIKYLEENHLKDFVIDYAITSSNVIVKVSNNKSDLGIFAVYNSNSGIVKESFTAMGYYNFQVVSVFDLKVSQCLHVKPGVTIEQIKRVISHPQAIAQSDVYLKTYLRTAEIIEGFDTAFEVQKLIKGEYDDKVTAVIASKICQSKFNSKILVTDIQNDENNYTTFCVIRTLS